MIWLISDTHFGHKNICRSISSWKSKNSKEDFINNTRDFPSIELMNETLINHINERVEQNDTLYHLGDWSFGKFENIKIFWDRLVCKNIHLVLGNHDKRINQNRNGIRGIFKTVSQYLEINIEKQKIILFHYPIESWHEMGRGSWMLHGHCHGNLHRGKLNVHKNRLDVGVDTNDFYPYSFEDVKRKISCK